jgi:hypothetical protein
MTATAPPGASAPAPSARSLARDLAGALDPCVLAEAAGVSPDPWQAGVLRSPASRLLLNCSRQSGKSLVAALLGLHAAAYEPGALVLLLSPTLRQSGELFRQLKAAYAALVATGFPLPPGAAATAETLLRLELANGSRIVSLPGQEHTIRGYSRVRLLVVDEAARVPDALYLSVRPMLAVSRGRLVALSTPFGTRGWWYEAWRAAERGEASWERYAVPATDCPRISAEFLAEERRTLGEWWYEQEYLCRFLDAETQAFRREDVDRAQAEEIEAWTL